MHASFGDFVSSFVQGTDFYLFDDNAFLDIIIFSDVWKSAANSSANLVE